MKDFFFDDIDSFDSLLFWEFQDDLRYLINQSDCIRISIEYQINEIENIMSGMLNITLNATNSII
jgi:hypothetical protein